MCDLRGIRQSHANTELAWAVSNLIANRNQYGSLFETKTSAAKCIYNNMVAMKYAGAEYVFILDEKVPSECFQLFPGYNEWEQTLADLQRRNILETVKFSYKLQTLDHIGIRANTFEKFN